MINYSRAIRFPDLQQMRLPCSSKTYASLHCQGTDIKEIPTEYMDSSGGATSTHAPGPVPSSPHAEVDPQQDGSACPTS